MSIPKLEKIVGYGLLTEKCKTCKKLKKIKYKILASKTYKHDIIYLIEKDICQDTHIKTTKLENTRRIYIVDNISNF